MIDVMKVKFEFTLDDVVEGVERTADRSTTVGNWRFAQMLATCAGAFVFSFIVIPGPISTKLVWATAMGLIAAYIHRSRSVGSRKRRMKQLFLERFGPTGPYVCEVDVGPTGLLTNQMGTQTRREWSAIQSVEITGDAIEFVMKGLGGLTNS